MNLNELKKKVESQPATSNLTLADLIGKSAVLPLPAGLHECKIVDVTSTGASKSFRMVVEAEDKQQYSININIGTTPEQAGIFMSIISHLLDQLGLKTLDIEAIKAKKGETICVLGTDKTTDRGTFTNFSFNPVVMAAALK